MHVNRADPVHLAATCGELYQLARTFPTNKDWLVDVGVVDAVLMAMRRFPRLKLVQRFCAQAVSEMSLFAIKVQTAAGQKGVVELVVDMMRRWSEDPEMQVGGHSGCFMDFTRDNRLRFKLYGGIEVLMDAIRNHMDHESPVLQAWFGFSSGTQEPNTQHFVDAGGIELAVESFRRHPKAYRVREEIMQALRPPLLTNREVRNTLGKMGYINDLAAAMQDAPLDFHQIAPACASLAMLTSENRTHRLLAQAAGVTQLALKAIVEYPQMKSIADWSPAFDSQYAVYDECLRVLVVMLSECDAHRYLLEANATGAIDEVYARPAVHFGSDMEKLGWGSSNEVKLKFGHFIQSALQKPCTEDPRDVVHSKAFLMW